jgi:hypothetical protein
MRLPELTDSGDLPLGVHRASLREVLDRFAVGHSQRIAVGERLERVYRVAAATGRLARFVVFGSFVTGKAEPNDVDVFLIMDDAFEGNTLHGESAPAVRPRGCGRTFRGQRVLGSSSCSFRRRAGNDRLLAGQTRRRTTGHHRDRRGDE